MGRVIPGAELVRDRVDVADAGAEAVEVEVAVAADLGDPADAGRRLPADIDIRISGRAGRITLTRESALNALSYRMCIDIDPALAAWTEGRAFGFGGRLASSAMR